MSQLPYEICIAEQGERAEAGHDSPRARDEEQPHNTPWKWGRVRLLPPRAFSDRRAEAKAGIDPDRHPIIVMAFASGCSGMVRVPTIDEFNTAMRGGVIGKHERQAIRAVLDGVETTDLIRAYREGAYSMQGLVRAMHEVYGDVGHERERTKSINYWRDAAWRGDITQYDPCPDSYDTTRRRWRR